MIDVHCHKGYVYLIGAGPGDPGLITVKGRECIGRADVILYDYLANSSLLSYAKPGSELLNAGKIGGAHNREQWQINQLMVEKAREGKVVARLKGGDPFVFGRGGEECEFLVAAGIPFEVVPGVTAAIGASAYAGIPLTHRDFTTSVAFVTGHESPGKEASGIDWERLSLGSGTVVFYMGMKNLPYITRNMTAYGRAPETPVAVIRWGTRSEQEVLTGTLADIAEKARRVGFKAPAITVIGEVVSLRDKLRWYDRRPLFGKGVLVMGAADQASELTYCLTELGARVYECPTIRIEPPESFHELDEAINGLNNFSWLILNSLDALQGFFGRLHELGRDSRAIGSCRICAIGPRTNAALANHGIKADLSLQDYEVKEVAEAFKALEIQGHHILLPLADEAGDVIAAALKKLGAHVAAPVAYLSLLPNSLAPEALRALDERRIHCIAFTSSAAARNLATMMGEQHFREILEGVAVATIGLAASKTCRELGLSVVIEPEKQTIAALTDAIVRFFS